MFELFPREMFELFPRLLLKKQNYSTFIRSKTSSHCQYEWFSGDGRNIPLGNARVICGRSMTSDPLVAW
ncbi:hypothetical protein Y032_0118g780 [Ancylostoma ceylanicum]|uniref:Uncharacterized protein n=1 Tax=Ancylostoma ceylanicum TaxID=53326 RepID=A0A016TBX4_9BILA|nr:hypothetical protein Y032_0118g780 [Ancylostoma ceylanicum]